ncbi:LacI family DNA-binding transcriptional regulator [Celeribacter sp.]|uniref:LacI family DNA-binding transcriptional regulator n=1 Tax=Celeribacter sp. TaxID=1890673 RepID=UPI003A9244FB
MSTATLKDIAERTGYSVNTVSLALRGSSRISKETQERVRLEAERLNYIPNRIARSLVSQESRSIGLLLTDLNNPIITAVAREVETKLTAKGYSTFFASSNNEFDEEKRMISFLREQRADGMVVFPCLHGELEHFRRLRERGYPIVLLTNDPAARIDSVAMNEFEGASKATEYLINIGHRRIGLIDGGTVLNNTDKFEGYRAALAVEGIDLDTDLTVCPDGYSVASGYWAMNELMSRNVPITAVLATMDSMALGAMRYCVEKGLSVPKDISVMGFDDTEFGKFATPALSSVNYDSRTIAHMVVDLLLGLVRGKKELPPPRNHLLEPHVIIRESTAKPKAAHS